MIKPVRLALEDAFSNTYYLFQTRQDYDRWHLAFQDGTPASFANITDDAMMLRFLLEDCESDADAAKAAVIMRCSNRVKNVRIVG